MLGFAPCLDVFAASNRQRILGLALGVERVDGDALAAELGIATFPTYDEGRHLIEMSGKVASYSGSLAEARFGLPRVLVNNAAANPSMGRTIDIGLDAFPPGLITLLRIASGAAALLVLPAQSAALWPSARWCGV